MPKEPLKIVSVSFTEDIPNTREQRKQIRKLLKPYRFLGTRGMLIYFKQEKGFDVHFLSRIDTESIEFLQGLGYYIQYKIVRKQTEEEKKSKELGSITQSILLVLMFFPPIIWLLLLLTVLLTSEEDRKKEGVSYKILENVVLYAF